MATKIQTLFFDGDGCGPIESEIWVERHDPKRPEQGDTLYFGLRVTGGVFGFEKSDAGGFMLAPEQAADLHRQLGEALGADLGTAQGRIAKLEGLLRDARAFVAFGALPAGEYDTQHPREARIHDSDRTDGDPNGPWGRHCRSVLVDIDAALEEGT